jgi:hypothetical protein
VRRNRLVGCHFAGACPVSRWIRPISHPRSSLSLWLWLWLWLLSLHSIASQRNNGLIITAFQVNLEPHVSEKSLQYHPVSFTFLLPRPETMRKRHLLLHREERKKERTKKKPTKGRVYTAATTRYTHSNTHTHGFHLNRWMAFGLTGAILRLLPLRFFFHLLFLFLFFSILLDTKNIPHKMIERESGKWLL